MASSSSPDERLAVGLGGSAEEGGGGGGLRLGTSTGGSTAELTDAEIEERELVEWASLKECQIKFMRENGV